jgi:hypothetical protein
LENISYYLFYDCMEISHAAVAGIRTVRSPQECPFQSSFTPRTAQFTQGISPFSQVYLPTPQWHHFKARPFLSIHSADEHRMIYSFLKPLLTPHFNPSGRTLALGLTQLLTEVSNRNISWG